MKPFPIPESRSGLLPKELVSLFGGLSEANRAIRLRMSGRQGIVDDVLLVKQVSGQETMCGGLEYRLYCVSLDPALPLKDFIAVPVEVQFVTDRGEMRSVCGIVAEAMAGQADGGLATYQLFVRDALALMEQRVNTRVFRNLNEVDLSAAMLREWKNTNPILAKAFDIDMSGVRDTYPTREFTMQHNESDAAFLRRLWKRRGISWFIRPGQASNDGSSSTPAHTLVLFDSSYSLVQNAAGAVRFNNDRATQAADAIYNWSALRTLRSGSATRQSWDYRSGGMMSVHLPTVMQQGEAGTQFAFSLDDYVVDPPHAGHDAADYQRLGELRIRRHEYASKCFRGEGGVRDLCVGQWFRLDGHPEIDMHNDDQREFVLTQLWVSAENNLPKTVDERVQRLFSVNGWQGDGIAAELHAASVERDMRYTNRFACVRRGIPIVPAFDPRTDLPRVTLQTAIVVGPPGEEVYCDALGRVKLRFPGTREQDHASGPGASNTDTDSAWIRVASFWASDKWGSMHLPRVGNEVLVDFLGGDPDKPVVVGSLYGKPLPPAFSHTGELPGNRFLAGIKSKEVKGIRYNQLQFDDTPGQISTQLASEHGHSQLNLGWLTRPRQNGQGGARGEGAELRSDGAVSVRGKSGVFISAEAQRGAQGALLQRESLLGLAEVLQSVQQQLSELAQTHHADSTPAAQLGDLVKRLKAWENGTNVSPDASEGQAAVVAVSAPAGVAIGSQDNVLLGAQTQIDLISVGTTHVSAGKTFLVRAAESISLFAHKLGLKLIAASGKLELQTHKDDMELTSAKRIVLSAADEIVLQAPKLRFIAQGAQVDIGGNEIVQQCSGNHTIKSAKFAHLTGGGGNVASLNLPASDIKTDERIILFDQQSGLPVKDRAYRAILDDGQEITGKTDAEGRTELMHSVAMGEVRIIIDPHSDNA
ncbi:type VI secretion system tip protein VgrG [Massilia sp. Dwa41.01b]|uniref:type VI secretion system Vgr family protein n=1 Tax=unclassified Massilia TaxID=2609279 RepID=UPI001601D04C|nr:MULTISPECIES: type VI secretion system Vgr family protein [unclassified Massilia]QNA88344.1 type VI secretion system tip protein VgrG [Massilia sp. Dwa41.01b]QNA99243.1 type VI secretion system tip protein VgrG [Massilia sp. Se16.2.3]